MRPIAILPYSNHYLKDAMQERRQWPYSMVVQSIPPGQFTVVDTKTVLDKLLCLQEGAVHKYGPSGFR